MAIPARVADRLSAGIKYFQPILKSAKERDINEADTVTIVGDILSDIFGYDKFTELTKELSVKSTSCDLAVCIEKKVRMIVEVKRIGAELKETYIDQAMGYAAKEGVEWFALTNGHQWRVFKVVFDPPIDSEQTIDIDLFLFTPKSASQSELLFLLTRESMLKSGLDIYINHVRALNKYTLGALLLSPPMLGAARKELRKIFPEVKVQVEDIEEAFERDVLKQDVIEGEKFEAARKKISRAVDMSSRTTKKEKEEPVSSEPNAATEQKGAPAESKPSLGPDTERSDS